MRNTIRYVKHDEVNKVKQYFHEKDHGLLVELYGQELPTWQSYAQEIAKKLNFPIENAYTFDGYLDWITDLSWHDDIEEFAIIIYDYSSLLKGETLKRGKYRDYIIEKEFIVASFVEDILPWWEHDRDEETYGVYEKAKPFNVYLVG